ncbi:MAG: hypothetical protein CMQ21_06035 [Gammaproteobacteria bacterium]|nr:hypothetical protein [Gammaproteobacteria bacterium]
MWRGTESVIGSVVSKSCRLEYHHCGPVRLQVQGNFQLDKEQYSSAPLRILFDKESTNDTQSRNQEKLKLVLPCRQQDSYLKISGSVKQLEKNVIKRCRRSL